MGEMLKASFQRALKAGVKIAFAVNANGAHGKQEGPYHGEEAVEFRLMTQYGMPPCKRSVLQPRWAPQTLAGRTDSGPSRKASSRTSLEFPAIPRKTLLNSSESNSS